MSFNERGSREREAQRLASMTQEQRDWVDTRNRLWRLQRAGEALRRVWLRYLVGCVATLSATFGIAAVLMKYHYASWMVSVALLCALVALALALHRIYRLLRLRRELLQIAAALEALEAYRHNADWPPWVW